ncbi:MAG: nucleotidyltransferase family protein [Anaerolineae bacterium]|nr:MAG: nucleotidyltransferase family protein [Anaerolineae bacterium]
MGKRLRPLIGDVPKPMAPIHGRPFLEHQLHLLSRYGFWCFVLCVGYKAAKIMEYFGNGSKWGYTIEYSVEERPMGTAGALRCASDLIDPGAPFLAMNGDTYFDTDFGAMVAFHQRLRSQQDDMLGTVMLTYSSDKSSYGSVVLDEESGRILNFAEKAQMHKKQMTRKKGKEADSSLVSAGIYVLEPDVLQQIPHDRPVSIEREVFPALCSLNALYGLPVEGSFVDIGTPEAYRHLSRNLAPLPEEKTAH